MSVAEVSVAPVPALSVPALRIPEVPSLVSVIVPPAEPLVMLRPPVVARTVRSLFVPFAAAWVRVTVPPWTKRSWPARFAPSSVSAAPAVSTGPVPPIATPLVKVPTFSVLPALSAMSSRALMAPVVIVPPASIATSVAANGLCTVTSPPRGKVEVSAHRLDPVRVDVSS